MACIPSPGARTSLVLATLALAPPAVAQGTPPDLAVAMEGGAEVVVQLAGQPSPARFTPYGSAFTGGVRVAVGDVDDDEDDDAPDVIVSPGPGGGPHVQVHDGASGALVSGFDAYPQEFRGGIFVAVGDVNGDGRLDIATVPASSAGPHVKVFDGRSGGLLHDFDAFDPGLTDGARIALGDINGDRRADIVATAGFGGGPHVVVFDGRSGRVLLRWDPAALGMTGEVSVAVVRAAGGTLGDVVCVGELDASTSMSKGGGGPHVRVFSGSDGSPVATFGPYPGFTGGVRVAVGDVNGDGSDDLLLAPGPGSTAQALWLLGPDALDGSTLPDYFPGHEGGVFVAATAPRPVRFGSGFESQP